MSNSFLKHDCQPETETKEVVAVLSTTIIPLDGTYKVTTVENPPVVKGVPHYIGHPATVAIVEEMGATPSPSKLFSGLKVGERALAVSIKQGLSNRATLGFTTPHQEVGRNDLSFRIIERLF